MRIPTQLLVLAAGLGACAAPKVAVEARYMSLEIEGDLAAEDMAAGVSTATELEALGLTGSDETFGARVDIDLGSPHFTFYGLQAAFAGTGTTTAEIDLGGGNVIGADVDVDTEFDFAGYTGMLTFDLVPSDFVEVGIGIAVMLVELEFTLQEVGGPNSIESEESLPVPLGALRAGFDIGPFELDTSIAAIDLDIDEGELSIMDIDLAARYHLFGGDERAAGFIVLGYHSLELEAQYEDGTSDVDINFLIEGPYVGFRLAF
jgi:hypothetical protein